MSMALYEMRLSVVEIKISSLSKVIKNLGVQPLYKKSGDISCCVVNSG
jgi:hypothetical protein